MIALVVRAHDIKSFKFCFEYDSSMLCVKYIMPTEYTHCVVIRFAIREMIGLDAIVIRRSLLE